MVDGGWRGADDEVGFYVLVFLYCFFGSLLSF